MVRPTSDDEKRDAMNQLKIGIVLLVGVSAGLTAFFGGGSLLEIAVALGAGLIVGVVLLAYLVRIA